MTSNTSNGLSDDEIDCLGSRMLKGTMTRWMGVFARDKLPSDEELLRAQMLSGNQPFAFVFNNQPASEPGQHWLAIYGKDAPLGGNSLTAATQTSVGGKRASTLTLNFPILMLCLQPPTNFIRISNIFRTFFSIRFICLALLFVVIIVCTIDSLARTTTLILT